MLLPTENVAGLLLTLAVPLLISQVPILYLRPTLMAIIGNLCGSAIGAEFWVRSAALLAALGSLSLSLIFTTSVRGLIIASLLGSFAAVAFITKAIWQRMPKATNAEAHT